MSDRCTGQCCRRFPLNMTPTNIREQAGRRAARDPSGAADDAMIADMVIWVASEPIGNPERGEYRDFYSCKHLLLSGDCGAYERRPAHMCGDCPYGKACEHGALCEWDLAREGYHQGAKVRGLRRIVLGQLGERRVHLSVVPA